MTDKLAEEILDEAHKISSAMPLSAVQKHFTYLAMQRYHEAKMKEVTDEDIFVVADKKYPCYDEDGDRITDLNEGFIEGAKAFRNGEIKHNREV